MSDALSKEAIESACVEATNWRDNYVGFMRAMGETILALIAERDARRAEECTRLAAKPVDEINAWRERLERENAERDVYARADNAARAVRAHFDKRHALADEDGNLTAEQFRTVSDELCLLVREKTAAKKALDAWKAGQ